MKIDRVTYKKIFPLAPYVNQQIGVEVQVDEGEDPKDALDYAKGFIEGWHKDNNKELVYFSDPAIQIKSTPTLDEKYEQMKADISEIPTREDALNTINLSEYRYVTELQAIALSKPPKNK